MHVWQACTTQVLANHGLPEPFLAHEACMAGVLGHTGLSKHTGACQVNAQADLGFLLTCLALSRLRAARLLLPA